MKQKKIIKIYDNLIDVDYTMNNIYYSSKKDLLSLQKLNNTSKTFLSNIIISLDKQHDK